jgi:hypothetical protein
MFPGPGLSKKISRIFLQNVSGLVSHIPLLNLYNSKQNFHANITHGPLGQVEHVHVTTRK